MNKIKYHLQKVATVACTKILVEATKGIGQRDIKGDTGDFFPFDIWFYSKKLDEAAMGVGESSLIDLVNI